MKDEETTHVECAKCHHIKGLHDGTNGCGWWHFTLGGLRYCDCEGFKDPRPANPSGEVKP